jgi:23S rRNA pseudouridine955/2504/2580 synthase
MSSSNTKKFSVLISQAQTGLRLDQFLTEWVPQVAGEEFSKAKMRKLIQMGFVFLNGSRCKIASKELRFKARVEIFLDRPALMQGDETQTSDRIFELKSSDIVFEDDAIIVMNKPFGLPTQPTLDRKRPCLYTALIQFLSEREGKPAYVGLHHRLDRDTSGVILFTKKKEANLGVSRIFQEHLAQKTYYAITGVTTAVATAVKEIWQIDNFLGKTPGTKKSSIMKSVRSGGDRAITDFKRLWISSTAQLIEAKPLTGRMHQIRVHLAEGGLPIFGDRTYGTDLSADAAPRLMLHARILTFPHPMTGQVITVAAPLPEDFQKCMKKHHLELPS